MKNQLSTAIVLLTVACLSIFVYAQDKKPTQRQILEATPFDSIVLSTLVAMEQNYKAKEKLCPLVHEDDYYAVILNTTKRIVLKSKLSQKISAPGKAAAGDSTSTKKTKK